MGDGPFLHRREYGMLLDNIYVQRTNPTSLGFYWYKYKLGININPHNTYDFFLFFTFLTEHYLY